MAGDLLFLRIQREMHLARDARQHHREGRARVCARRAAGWALEPRWSREHPGQPAPGAYMLLSWLVGEAQAPAPIRLAAQRLTVHVSTEFNLPHAQDPLDDASIIIKWAAQDSS
jgi:hypothetical protein